MENNLASPERTQLDLPEDLPVEAWRKIGEQILTISDSSSWWIGDWLIFGQRKYCDRYRVAMRETNLDYQTLRNYAWVARRFDASRRRDSLTFHHHMEVTALSVEMQEHWLGFAERFGWSRNALRKQIRASVSNDDDVTAQDVRVELQVSPDRIKRWEEAAELNECQLIEWIASVLDGAVTGTSTDGATERKVAARYPVQG
jgi:hypothetical protein